MMTNGVLLLLWVDYRLEAMAFDAQTSGWHGQTRPHRQRAWQC
jgi:hypothetical protein